MKKDYRFWEQNFNPITMQPSDNRISSSNSVSEARIQELDERHMERLRKTEVARIAKTVGKSW